MNLIKKHPVIILGISITFLFLFLGFIRLELLDILELKFYDLKIKIAKDDEKPNQIVIVDIDDDSIDKLGRWPWPRSLIADGIQKINSGTPRVIGLNIILSEPEAVPALSEIKSIETSFIQTFADQPQEKLDSFIAKIHKSIEKLDNDKKLDDFMKESSNIVLPLSFNAFSLETQETEAPDNSLISQSIMNVSSQEGIETIKASGIILPIPSFLKAAKGLGHINFTSDLDGTTRRELLIVEYQGLYIPSYALKLASIFMNISTDEIKADLGSMVTMGQTKIPLTLDSKLLVNFKGPRGSFKTYSFFDVLNDKISLNVFKDKLVLVSPSATGIMNPFSAPTDPGMPIGELTANTIWTILNQKFIRQPIWGAAAEPVLILFIGMLLIFIFPRLKALTANILFWGILIVLFGGSIYVFAANGLWIQVIYPALQLILGYLGVISIKYFAAEVGKEKVEGESIETNRMLGLSFQSQGMLDMAFDKFRKIPVNDEMKDILYNLALDYERKRQFNKAVAVYEHIETHDTKFKDVAQKKRKLMQASETMVFGDGFLGGGSENDGLLSTGTDTRPTLGRYEVIKQLGKGAMGIVYLGQDPRINRTTAIKTFRFPTDLEEEEAEELKLTFFREAESAGTLSHPNIVTIYDAGEEQDLAYIAMEFLEGEDLQNYTKKGKLLSIRKVIDYTADIAEGLDYAHEKGIVHRDIKPANIMRLNTGVIKITDFGIARITDSSQTRTGIVKGTPFYMSPEQISGKKVDGRSDIFSLGVMMYQLLTGKVPFDGDSPAALMHQILNEPHPDPKTINPKIMKPLVTIINKSLEKDPEKRYQKAAHLAAHLRQLGKKIDTAIAQKKAT